VEGNVQLKVFDVIGREVTTLIDGYQNAGNYSVIFNASSLSSGVYIYRITTGGFVQTKRMVLAK